MSSTILEEIMSTTPEVLRAKAELTPETMQGVVKGKESPDAAWKEVVEIGSFSATGAGFFMPREVKVGTIVAITIPLPAHLRCYDHEKDLYRVLGLVQHCQPSSGENPCFHVGVAFVGRQAPDSYKENPKQNYRICGMNENGLWNITETRAPFKVRRHLRYWTTIELYLAVIDSRREAMAGEKTTTENVSKSGASVYTTLDIGVGDRVKFISEEYDFSGLAVVCNHQLGTDGRHRLNLQFVENTFPVEKLDTKRQAGKK